MGKMPQLSRGITDGSAPPGRRGNFREAMEAIILPDTITCALCKRDLPLRRFSTTALRRLRSSIHHNGMGFLSNQQVARCDGCGTQSRPELHCMACNTTRPIDEFAHTQRQYDQPVCLLCQDGLQEDERDRLLARHLSRNIQATSESVQLNGDNSESTLTFTTTTESTERAREFAPEEDNTIGAVFRSMARAAQIFKQQNAGSTSNSTTRNSLRTYRSEEEMQFDAVFD